MFTLRRNRPDHTTLRTILRGVITGRMQSVGLMQVIPLLPERNLSGYIAPDKAEMDTVNYGEMRFVNPGDDTLIVPCHAGYMVRQKAQNHAMSHLGMVKGRTGHTYNTAMCIQSGQGGYIKKGNHALMILPFSLREKALQLRKEKAYNKLWSDIEKLNSRMGLRGRGHLEDFLDRFTQELDQFVAEFECVPNQVGAIILINGEVAGVERTPSTEYWLTIWQPLIRECYGSLAIETAHVGQKDGTVCTDTRVPLSGPVTNLAELKEALHQADQEAEERVCFIVRDLLDHPLDEEIERVEGLNRV